MATWNSYSYGNHRLLQLLICALLLIGVVDADPTDHIRHNNLIAHRRGRSDGYFAGRAGRSQNAHRRIISPARAAHEDVAHHSSAARVQDPLTYRSHPIPPPVYHLLGEPLPALPFKPRGFGNFNVQKGSVSQELVGRMLDAAINAHKKLVRAGNEDLSRADIISVLEPIPPEEFGKGRCRANPCRAGWKDVEERQASVVYLSSVVDLSKYKRKVYIDGGANTYDSSIGGWFLKTYPQASTGFDIYAFEVNPEEKYAKSYANTGVEFLPYAIWTHTTTLTTAGYMSSISLGQQGVDTAGGVQTMPAIDFVEWLVRSVTPEDFVVLKLDIEGAEFEVVEKMISTGAVHLIDELFVECHYNKWSKARPDKTRKDCVDFVMNIRTQGIVAHDWF